MRLTAARINKVMDAARRRQQVRDHEAGRIQEVIVHLDAEPGDPLLGRHLVLPARGRQPAIYELREVSQ